MRPGARSDRRPAPRRWARRLARVGTATAVLATTLVLGDVAPAAAGPTPVMRGYVPLPADQMQAVMELANTGADTTLDFTVGITNAGNGSTMYYDHWEDGFEADIANPVQSTTEVWGDGNTGNGDAAANCATCSGDLLTPGDVFVLRNSITTPRNSSEIRFDGRDKVASTRGFAITAGGFSTPLGSVLSAAVSAYDTSKYGTAYVAPVGEDTGVPTGGSPAFETSSLVVMAAQDATTVQVDSDADGTVDTTQTIDEGEVVFVGGGVLEGATVTSDKPVQVHEGTGDAGASYESRWFTLFPTNLLSSDYLNPVGSTTANQDTVTYLHNPGSTSLTITPTCTSCSGTIALAAHTTTSFLSPSGEAVRFASTGPFVAVGAAGALSGTVGAGSDQSATYDWGFSLVPTGLLTTQAVLGWAPGNSANPPSGAADDFDPVWVTTLTSTTVHVDFDGDPSTGAISTADCVGSHDLELSVAALASTRITDPSDSDMTGARIYTCDGTKIAGAWGEDPAAAPAGSPGFDAGYAIIPSTTMIVDKTVVAVTDANGDGQTGPGDTITYGVDIADAGSLAFTNVAAEDTLPAGVTYVAGSTEVDTGSVVIPIADDTAPPAATIFPLDETGAALPDINAGDTIQLRYQVAIDDPFPGSTASITNSVTVTSDEASGGDVLTTALAESDLRLAKTATTPPTNVGDDATFRLTITNDGPDAAAGVTVDDPVPTGATYVSSTASQGSYSSSTGIWNVGTIPAGASRTLDVTMTILSTSVTNDAEIASSDSIDPDSTPGNAAPSEDDIASTTVTAVGRSLGDRVFYDADGDGTQDAGEPGLAGVDVTVTWFGPNGTVGGGDDVQSTDTTDASGTWAVTDLAPGNYSAAVTTGSLPHGIDVPTADLDGTGTASTAAFTVAGSDRTDVDFGYTGAGTVGDTVFEDIDGDGAPDSGEGLAGVDVTVTWLGPNGSAGGGDDVVVATVTTDASGAWSVSDLPAGNVLVVVDPTSLPSGFTNTTDPDGGTADRSVVTLAAGASDLTQDFGYRGDGSIGDTIWSDTDGDGTQDAGEPGLGGVLVTLTKDVDADSTYETTVAVATSAGTGSYSFTGLSAGNYRVTATAPAGLDATTPLTVDVVLAASQDDDTVDVGFEAPAPPTASRVGDRVWSDTDGDGVQDAGEPGLTGVTVALRTDGDANGSFETVLSTITTASDGSYDFSNLPPGSYRVVVTPPTGKQATTPTAVTVDLVAGANVDDVDVGLIAGTPTAGSIGDLVWDDLDGDGVHDGGEPGLTAVTVTLRTDLDGDGVYETTTASTTTAGDGSYSFTGVAPGSHRIVVAVPGGRVATTATVVPVELSAGEAVTDADVGLRTSAPANGTVGDRVWSDIDRDRSQDAGEPGLNGVTVTLRSDADGDGEFESTVGTTTTSGDGDYSFTAAPGRYLIVVTAPDGQAPTSASVIPVVVTAGGSVTDADVGMATPVSLPYDLRITSTIDGTPRPGDDVTVQLDVRNGGPSASPTDVTVTTVLPDGLTYRSVDAPGWTCSNAGQTVTCVLPAGLANGAQSAIDIVTRVTGPVGATLVANSTVSAAGVEITTSNNAAAAPVEVLAATATPTSPADDGNAAATPLAATGGRSTGGLLLALGTVCLGIGIVVARARPFRRVRPVR